MYSLFMMMVMESRASCHTSHSATELDTYPFKEKNLKIKTFFTNKFHIEYIMVALKYLTRKERNTELNIFRLIYTS